MDRQYCEASGHGPNLILLHGWGMHSGIFSDLSFQLNDHYHVISFDLPGHGQSPSIDPYNLETVLAFILARTPSEPCYWVGWSLGGNLALEIASRYPSRVNALCLLACNPCFIAQKGWPGVEINQIQGLQMGLFNNPQAALSRFVALQFQGIKNAKKQLNRFKECWLKQKTPSLEVLNSMLEILQSLDLRNNLKYLKVPTMFLLGADDCLVPVQIVEHVKPTNPDIQCNVIHGAGHVPFFGHLEHVVQMLTGFFSSTRSL